MKVKPKKSGGGEVSSCAPSRVMPARQDERSSPSGTGAFLKLYVPL